MTPRPTPVPTLDQLAQNPARVADLPPALVRDLYPVAARLEAELRARLLAAGGDDSTAGPEDRAFGLVEAAAMLGMKRGTLYRKWRALGIGYRDADGRVKFTRATLHRYIARRGG